MLSFPIHTIQRMMQGFSFCTLTLIFSILALFSFKSLLQFFNYPLITHLEVTPFTNVFLSSICAGFLPPLFIIGFSRHAPFKQRLLVCFQVQAFFYAFLCLVHTAYIVYTLETQTSLSALTYIHYYSALNRILLCLYFYFSIRMSLGAMPQPLPYYVHDDTDSKDAFSIPGAYLNFQGQNYYHITQSPSVDVSDDEDSFIYLSQNSIQALDLKKNEHRNVLHKSPSSEHCTDNEAQTTEQDGEQHPTHTQYAKNNAQTKPFSNIKNYILLLEEKRNNKLEQKAFERHGTKIPVSIAVAINFAQIITCVLIFQTLFGSFDAPPNFIVSHHYLALFFLQFYLLYLIRKRPYALWRHAFLWLNVYFFLVEYSFESLVWQGILLGYFCVQMLVTLTFYRKGKNWFIS